MVVSWRLPPPPDIEEMLARGPPSALSRMALEMEAVSPFRRASTILNLRTDCSREPLLVSIEVLGGGESRVGGERATLAGDVDEDMDMDGLEPWRLTDCGGCVMFVDEDFGVAARMGSAEALSLRELSASLDSEDPRCFPRRRARALADFVRL